MPCFIRSGSFVPTPIHSRCTRFASAAGSAIAPLNAVFISSLSLPGAKTFAAPLNPPMYENRSRWLNVTLNVCMPPIERPAIARCSRSGMVRKFASMNGMRAFVTSSPNAETMSCIALRASGVDGGPPGIGVAAPARCAYPFGMTMIIGLALPAAIRLSRTKLAAPAASTRIRLRRRRAATRARGSALSPFVS